MSVLTRLDNEMAELRFAFRYYKEGGQRSKAWACYWELQGLRRARGIVVRAADSMERAA